MAIRSYQDLDVWKRGIELVKLVYPLTASFPKQETYGLSSQIQRAAVSIPANIAEGRSRTSTKEFLYHLNVAYGSMSELETHLIIANELGFITRENLNNLMEKTVEIGKMLNGLKRSLDKRKIPDPRTLAPNPLEVSA